MQFERKLNEIGGSLMLVIPADLCRFLELSQNDVMVMQDEDSKKGKFVSFWKKK